MTATALRRDSFRSGIDRAGLDEAAGGNALMVDDGRACPDEAILPHRRVSAHCGVGRDEAVLADAAVMVDGRAGPHDCKGPDARADVDHGPRHDEGTLADGGRVPDVGARVNEGRRRIPSGAHAIVQRAPLAQMLVAHRDGDRVRGRAVAARHVFPRAQDAVATVQVVDEAGERVAALDGEIADDLPELARAVYEDLLRAAGRFARTNAHRCSPKLTFSATR